MIYAPCGRPFAVRMDKISGGSVRAWWFNPRTGEAVKIGEFPNKASGPSPADRGEQLDWILVLDDAARRCPPPGTR